MNNKLITFIVVAILIIVGTFYMFKYAKAPTSNLMEENKQQQKFQSKNATQTQPNKKITVEMTPSGFFPKELIVKKGSEIIFINKDTIPHWPASGPHPAHTCYSGFDAKSPVDPGASYSNVFDLAKTCGFHDHLNFSSYGYGSITVTE
ncbi:MAG: hypothetical protein AAB795_01515 [Patescibacteria group bacterium]